jgi:hypothetical protein
MPTLDKFAEAWRYVGTATTAGGDRWEKLFEGRVHRLAGEIALADASSEAAKAEGYFKRALEIARLWRDQGKVQQAHDWSIRFTAGSLRGFDTLYPKRSQGAAGRVGGVTICKTRTGRADLIVAWGSAISTTLSAGFSTGRPCAWFS